MSRLGGKRTLELRPKGLLLAVNGRAAMGPHCLECGHQHTPSKRGRWSMVAGGGYEIRDGRSSPLTADTTKRVEIQRPGAHIPRVSLRPLFAFLIAFAMSFAPFAMQAGSAMAAMPSDHHSQMLEKGHCGGQSDEGMADKALGKSCCVAMCTAIAVAPVSPGEPLAFSRIAERPALAQFRRSYLAKLPTPPPRRA